MSNTHMILTANTDRDYGRIRVNLPSGRVAIVTAVNTFRTDYAGRTKYNTSMTLDGKVLFFNDGDLATHMRGANYAESLKAAALTAASFYTLRLGDTDQEYFDDYNADQLAWAATNNFDCEYMNGLITLCQERRGEI